MRREAVLRYQWSFQSARPARGATLQGKKGQAILRVSIRTPREGRDMSFRYRRKMILAFQSARPARGATTPLPALLLAAGSFNPHAPRGARRPGLAALFSHFAVSIRTPREGRDRIR